MLLMILFCSCLHLLLLDVAQVFQMSIFWQTEMIDQSSQVPTVQYEEIEDQNHNMKGCSQWG